MARLMPPMQESSRLVVACRPADFSASAIARAVEDTNAHLVNLNVTSRRLDDGRLTVELRTNHRSASAAVRSLERYGYEVLELDSAADPAADATDEMLRNRAANLLHLLEI
ncbi:MAG: hypothetical protein HDR45_02855 [Bacteroides sp.]|nr:hypothetical protein [Bacteroidales bacterium]MBD5425121.1 hypothetical protein [Bacteroides sp.]MDE6222567.1 hypothetical protein [Muribaculaceae bacterium]